MSNIHTRSTLPNPANSRGRLSALHLVSNSPYTNRPLAHPLLAHRSQRTAITAAPAIRILPTKRVGTVGTRIGTPMKRVGTVGTLI